MKRTIRFVLGAGMVAALGTAAAMAADVTVGQFLVEIAKVRNVSAADPESAARNLQTAGVNVAGLDLRKSLTEGDVARIADLVGVKVSTTQPEAPFTQRQVDNFVKTFAADLIAERDGDDPKTQGTTRQDPQPGKGKSKGFRSPSEPL